jgi:phosphatidylglycerol:prolipoprotein diacylglycerol transferase
LTALPLARKTPAVNRRIRMPVPLLALPFPMIDPVAVAVGPVAIRWYALAYIGGLVAGWLYARALVVRPKLWGGAAPVSRDDLDDLLVWATLGVVVGGRLVYVAVYNPAFFIAYPGEILQVWRGGMAFHGGLLGCVIAMWLVARVRKVPVLSLFDVVAAVAPIGLFLGRLANFANGELWGRVTEVSWAFVFPHAGPEPRHPSQLYQAALEGLLLFAVVTLVVRGGGFRRPGLVAGVFGAGYGVARIIGEQFREPDPQLGFLAGGLTMGMLLSLPLVLLGGWLIRRALARPAMGA